MERDYEATIKQLDEGKKRIMANFKYAIVFQSIMVAVLLVALFYSLSKADEHYKHQDKINQENVYVKPR